MDFTVNSKSQLAKLMATENIHVVHDGKQQTASFNLESRTLMCPIWKEMDGFLYDLIMGHEISHALHTPAEGWHDAATKNGKGYRHFLNVIEDARIEKMIKQKYPGLKKSFVLGYKDLISRDFFGIQKTDIDTLFFIDRLNLFTKTSGVISPAFTEKEREMITLVENTQTWEDVVRVTDMIYEYSKKEQEEKKMEFKALVKTMRIKSQKYDSDEEMIAGDNFDDKEMTEGDNFDDEEMTQEEIESLMEELEELSDLDEITSFTDKSFRQKEKQLVQDKNSKYIRAKLPKANLLNILSTPKAVYKQIIAYNENVYHYDHIKIKNDFLKRNDRYISLLVKEFEMKKAAKKYNNSKVSDTGDININKIYRYKTDDDIFRKAMTVPNGKSHGMIMLLDRSASMGESIAACIEQILVLVSFCRRVNIPFVVYGFSSSISVGRIDGRPQGKQFSQENDDLVFNQFNLREVINSNMGINEYNKALMGMMILQKFYFEGKATPESENMSSTPLNQSLVAMNSIIKNFKKKTNVDIVNLVIVHDGDADTTGGIYGENIIDKSYSIAHDTVFIRDEESNIELRMKNDSKKNHTTSCILNILRKKYECNVIGFFVTPRIYKTKNIIKKMSILNEQKSFENLKENRYLEITSEGYDKFFIMLSDTSAFDELYDFENYEIKGNPTASKLSSALKKFNKKREINRVMVNKFISQIVA